MLVAKRACDLKACQTRAYDGDCCIHHNTRGSAGLKIRSALSGGNAHNEAVQLILDRDLTGQT
jgi:hypothetical protein